MIPWNKGKKGLQIAWNKGDLTGQKFHHLAVLRPDGVDKHNKTKYRVKCDCDSPEFSINGSSLVRGLSKSCGCVRRMGRRVSDRERALISKRSTKDLTEQRFGRLQVLRRDGSRRDKRGHSAATWWVQCDCGSPEKSIISQNLTKGNATSCGCLKKELLTADLIGKKFGRLQVVGREGFDKYGATWHTQCECGKSKIVRTNALTSENVRSCGCLQQEISGVRELSGLVFGRLAVLRRGTNNKWGQARWWVQCRCGSPERLVVGTQLTKGHTRSCGCLNRDITSTRNLRQHLQGQSPDGYLYVFQLSSDLIRVAARHLSTTPDS